MLARRLEGARWVTQRRLLGVVARLPDTPDFVALPWLQHPDDGVRREALKVALRSRTERNTALGLALLDSDASMVRGALASALSGCPPEAVATIMRKVDDGSLAPELRSLGVRVVATLANHLCGLASQVLHERGVEHTVAAAAPPRAIVGHAALLRSLTPRRVRASSVLIGGLCISFASRAARSTNSTLPVTGRPFPYMRLSSIPTRRCPPMLSAAAMIGRCARPIPVADQEVTSGGSI
jgi:hypothetical protein